MRATLIKQIVRTVLRHPGYTGSLIRKKIRLANRYRWIADNRGAASPVPWPQVIKLVLTYQCNLRCRGCFQQGECESRRGELDFSVIERVVRELGSKRPDFIFTGGEPLRYSRFDDLAYLLEENRCYATVCTNGTELVKHRETVCTNRHLSYLISLDGTEAVNDAIRGKGVYRKVTEEIRRIKSTKRPPYIGIQFTIRENNIACIFAFCREMIDLGIDWILLNPFWFFTPEEAEAYEMFLEKHFSARPRFHRAFVGSYRPDCDTFVAELEKIRQQNWPVQISSYFSAPEQLSAYVTHPCSLTETKRCYKQWVRMDVTPEGDVAPCIQFPDITFGNLATMSVMDAWNHPDYRAFRRTILNENLPICSKCNNIYLYDAERTYL